MTTPTPLRLLGTTNNVRGDLFTRLVGDLFFALGYDELRYDVHNSGSEIDIQGVHRLEPRRMVAECKAHIDKMGGADLNKLLGITTRERGKHKPTPVTAYFVSLNGFRQTGIEQELQTDEQDRIILLDGQKVIDELIRIRILVSQADTCERAGRCAAYSALTDSVIDGTELLGHPLGYLWVVYYSQGKQRTHFALIHADGTPLATSVASEVIQADRVGGGSLHTLKYLSPPANEVEPDASAKAATERYLQWVVKECGDIQLDGLPADANLSAFSMKLERLFVPLKLVATIKEAATESEISSEEEVPENETVWPVGEFLSQHQRFSLLAKPGGGKSTLLKRLAVAYADPVRRQETDDQLPERNWLPLLLRCRELRDRAHRPIIELLEDLAKHAGMNGDETSLFRRQIDAALRSGQALLLIDGLDEIADEGTRTTFAGHLRSFLAMFPNVAMIATSREAGYRHVVGVIASACAQVHLASFDKADVTRLCESWHAVVVNDTETVREESRKLATTIWANERIRALAENPLMLTTLLVVRRCIGDLPRRRVELYGEAVKVLIRTWNTEGFAPMDLDETLAQLSYVACVMLNEGLQQIGHRRLLKLLQEARAEMPAELQFTKISPPDFVVRVEYRSSLLMQTGHERIDNELQPVYEFRHLTFQEYLAARGLIEEQYPGRDQGKSLVDLLVPHFEDESWREVIPLAAVLAGRRAESIVQQLTTICDSRDLKIGHARTGEITQPPVVLLRKCLLDEVQLSPATLRAALRQVGRFGSEDHLKGSVVNLRTGRFGEVFQEVVEAAYLNREVSWEHYAYAMSDLALHSVFQDQSPQFSEEVAVILVDCLRSSDRLLQIRAAFVSVRLAFSISKSAEKVSDAQTAYWKSIGDALAPRLTLNDPSAALAASFAMVWIGVGRLTQTPPTPDVLLSLFRLWREAKSSELRRFAAWAFCEQALLSRDAFAPDTWGDCDAWFEQQELPVAMRSKLVLAWYRRRPLNDSELAQKVLELKKRWRGPTGRELLAALGGDADEK